MLMCVDRQWRSKVIINFRLNMNTLKLNVWKYGISIQFTKYVLICGKREQISQQSLYRSNFQTYCQDLAPNDSRGTFRWSPSRVTKWNHLKVIEIPANSTPYKWASSVTFFDPNNVKLINPNISWNIRFVGGSRSQSTKVKQLYMCRSSFCTA